MPIVSTLFSGWCSYVFGKKVDIDRYKSHILLKRPYVKGYRYMYIAHLYCLAVQAGFYSDVVECSLSTWENLVTFGAQHELML